MITTEAPPTPNPKSESPKSKSIPNDQSRIPKEVSREAAKRQRNAQKFLGPFASSRDIWIRHSDFGFDSDFGDSVFGIQQRLRGKSSFPHKVFRCTPATQLLPFCLRTA